MEVGFALANLAGKEIKAIEKDEELFRDEERFKDYMFENEQLFKQMLMVFKWYFFIPYLTIRKDTLDYSISY